MSIYRYAFYNNEFENSYKYIHDFDEEDDLEWLAGFCAKDYYHNHDGWEGPEEYELYLYDDSGDLLGVFDILTEFEPTFSAHKREVNNEQTT